MIQHRQAHNSNDLQRIITTLAATLPFSKMDHTTLELFATHAHIHTHSKGHCLFVHTSEAEYLYLVENGWVKLFRETLDGNEAVIDVVSTHHIFGELALMGQAEHNCSAEIVEDNTSLVLIPIAFLKEQLAEHPSFSQLMLENMMATHKIQDKELEHRTLQNASQRIGCFLLRLCGADAASPISLHLPYDKVLIAARLGMKAETFSRALARLRTDTELQINGATVIINNLDKLVNYSCSACTDSYPCDDLETV